MKRNKIENIVGMRFGRLTVIEELEPKRYTGQTKRRVLCKCDCGNEKVVDLAHLVSGHTQSCGCYAVDDLQERSRKYNVYETDGEVTKVYDDRGNYALIDTEDLERIKPYYFSLADTGYFYTRRMSKGKFLLHRFIMNCPKGLQVDHINHNPVDNRKCNLRICTDGENKMNNKGRGYFFSKDRNKWRVVLHKNYKKYHFGQYNTEDEAKQAALKAKQELFGEFAYEGE